MAERCASYLMIQGQKGYDILTGPLQFNSTEEITLLLSNFRDPSNH